MHSAFGGDWARTSNYQEMTTSVFSKYSLYMEQKNTWERGGANEIPAQKWRGEILNDVVGCPDRDYIFTPVQLPGQEGDYLR